jgi:BASS family bile acid:Na+ symporter
VTLSFAGSMQQDILLIPVLYSLFIVITSSLVTVAFRRRSDREALARDKAKAGQLMAS